jgi:hypothetical protein
VKRSVPLSRRLRRAVAAGAVVAFLIVLAVLQLTSHDSTRPDRAIATPAQTPDPATSLTKTTRTTQIMTDETDNAADELTLVRKLAERYVEAVNGNDAATIAELNCAKATPGLLQIAASGQPVTLAGGIERAYFRDRYHVELAVGGKPGPPMTIMKKDGVWCVWD